MTKCENCKNNIEGVAYNFNNENGENFFCGKSCLVKYLLKEEIIYLKILKKASPVSKKEGDEMNDLSYFLSLCPSCHCMTKSIIVFHPDTLIRKCGKCGAMK